ncbi:MAG TPA: OmpA family protein [Stellaceae bacterium]|nr:OmpA family protein [Stellaceae bacterium]
MKRRWQRERPDVGHADDWLMTYADMITLLLCFFAVLLAASTSRKDVARDIAIAQIAPAATESVEPAPISAPVHIATHVADPVEDPAERPMPKVAHVSADAARAERDALPPQPLSSMGDIPTANELNPESSGDRIKTVEMNSATFFDRGSATLSKAGEAVLRDIALKLSSESLRDYQITVEGHTDDIPISTTQFPSNWELSTARAAVVVHFFLNENIPAQRLRAAGYADTFPKAPNRDPLGNAIPENQSQNRRVVIKLEKIEKLERHAVNAGGRT